MRKSTALSSCSLFCLFLGFQVSAAQLTWDPLNNTGITPANGNWDTTGANTVWYNGSGDVAWTQTSTTSALNNAVFGGADGSWAISIDAGQVAVSNLFINNSGYTFSGSPIFITTGDTLSIAAGKTATFNCNIAGSGNGFQYWALGSGSTMNFGGGISSADVHTVGPANSTFNFTGGAISVSQIYLLGPVNLSAGSITTSSAASIGYPNYTAGQFVGGTQSTSGSLTVSGSAVFTPNGNFLFVGREFSGVGGQGTLTLNGGTVNVGNAANRNLAICYDGGGAQPVTTGIESGAVVVNNGTLNVGSSSLACSINFFETSCYSGETATLTQTGGIINSWNGITFGGNTVSAYAGGIATMTQSGGALYIGGNGIALGTAYNSPNTFSITLSGGMVGALGNWSSSLPMTLGTTNGNINFQCADSGGASHNISLSGALTGPGGFYLTGGGTLTLSGANNYAGSTIISNGTLAIVTGSSPMVSGSVTLDGSVGSPGPALSVAVSSPGQFWTNDGALTFQNAISAVPSLSFQFGALSPSTSVAPIQINGNVIFEATPNVSVGGAALGIGTYPLIKYTGVTNGAMPNSVSVTLSSGSASGYLTNLAASKTIALVITSSTYNPALFWGVGSGVWDIGTTANWKQFGSPTHYTDGNAVIFDDSAAGPSPITVTLNTSVNPLSVTFNNAAPTNYTIAGTGSITGAGNLSLLGTGSVTLAGTNTYNGGTVINAGHLNINNGGSASATAIGTGPLTINSGAVIDNTSGADVVLQASIPETWNGNFTYAGSANNFNTGPGPVTMNSSIIITNTANNLTIGGNIYDNGAGFQLTKTGNGGLTLAAANNFSGGLTLFSGSLGLGDPNAAGYGSFTIYAGAIDNSSGAPLTLSGVSSYLWNGSFTYLGSGSDLDLGSGNTVNVLNGLGNMTLTVANNTLTTEYDIISGNTLVIKAGAGTWNITGGSTSLNNLGLRINAGQVNLAKNGGESIGASIYGLTVNAGAIAVDMNKGFQIHNTMPVTLAGGIWDLNGYSENINQLSMSGNSVLRMSAPGGASTLNIISGNTASLSGTNCQFEVTTNGTLTFQGAIGGSGSLVKTGLGELTLETNNVYTGSTLIESGTVALPGPSSISNTVGINLAATNSVLDISANTDTNGNPTPVLTLLNGQTLSGFGSVYGLLKTSSDGTLAPGSASAVGTLTVANVPGTNTLNGTTLMKLDNLNHTNDQVSVAGGLTYGGTLVLTNLTGSPANGDSYVLFNASSYSGSFSSLAPSTPGSGLAWDASQLAVSGILKVIAQMQISGISVSGTSLSISGAGGNTNGTYHVRTSTNAAASLASWTVLGGGSFDSHGNFNFSGSINPADQRRFYIVVEP
jgi:autotransporter-associated beta strand protein